MDSLLYAASAGFLVCLGFFFVALKKYQLYSGRSADITQTIETIPEIAVQPVKVSASAPATKVATAETPTPEMRAAPGAARPAPRPAVVPAATPAPAPVAKRPASVTTSFPATAPSVRVSAAKPPFGDVAAPKPAASTTGPTTTGGINPAVAYLQNLKNHLEHLEEEVNTLKGQLSNFAGKNESQFSALLERLGELKVELPTAGPRVGAAGPEQGRGVVPPVETSPAPAPAAAAPEIERAPSFDSARPADVVPLPKRAVTQRPAPQRELVAEPEPQAVAEALPEAATAEPAPVAAAEPASDAPESSPSQPSIEIEPADAGKPRRGPVWPV